MESRKNSYHSDTQAADTAELAAARPFVDLGSEPYLRLPIVGGCERYMI